MGDIITYSGFGDRCHRWPPDRHEPELEHRAPSLPRRHLPQPSAHGRHRYDRVVHRAGPRRQSYFEIKLTATDSAGLSSTVSVNIQPETVQFTLETSPPGLQVVFGGLSAAAPVTYTVIAGSTHTIFAASPQGGAVFLGWSDGGAQQHNVVVGATNVTYVASFNVPPPPVAMVSPPNGATGVDVAMSVNDPKAIDAPAVTATTITRTAQPASTFTAEAIDRIRNLRIAVSTDATSRHQESRPPPVLVRPRSLA